MDIIYYETYFATCDCPAVYRMSYGLSWGGGVTAKYSSVVAVGLEINFFNAYILL